MKQTRENGKITKQISTGQIKKEGPGEASVKRNYKFPLLLMNSSTFTNISPR